MGIAATVEWMMSKGGEQPLALYVYMWVEEAAAHMEEPERESECVGQQSKARQRGR